MTHARSRRCQGQYTLASLYSSTCTCTKFSILKYVGHATVDHMRALAVAIYRNDNARVARYRSGVARQVHIRILHVLICYRHIAVRAADRMEIYI